MNGHNGRRDLGRRLGVALGFIKPSPGPRPSLQRVLTVGADSSNGELIAGLVWTGLLVVVLGSNASSGPLWLRLTSLFLAVLLLVNPIRAVRLLLQRRRADRGRSPTG